MNFFNFKDIINVRLPNTDPAKIIESVWNPDSNQRKPTNSTNIFNDIGSQIGNVGKKICYMAYLKSADEVSNAFDNHKSLVLSNFENDDQIASIEELYKQKKQEAFEKILKEKPSRVSAKDIFKDSIRSFDNELIKSDKFKEFFEEEKIDQIFEHSKNQSTSGKFEDIAEKGPLSGLTDIATILSAGHSHAKHFKEATPGAINFFDKLINFDNKDFFEAISKKEERDTEFRERLGRASDAVNQMPKARSSNLKGGGVGANR